MAKGHVARSAPGLLAHIGLGGNPSRSSHGGYRSPISVAGAGQVSSRWPACRCALTACTIPIASYFMYLKLDRFTVGWRVRLQDTSRPGTGKKIFGTISNGSEVGPSRDKSCPADWCLWTLAGTAGGIHALPSRAESGFCFAVYLADCGDRTQPAHLIRVIQCQRKSRCNRRIVDYRFLGVVINREHRCQPPECVRPDLRRNRGFRNTCRPCG